MNAWLTPTTYSTCVTLMSRGAPASMGVARKIIWRRNEKVTGIPVLGMFLNMKFPDMSALVLRKHSVLACCTFCLKGDENDCSFYGWITFVTITCQTVASMTFIKLIPRVNQNIEHNYIFWHCSVSDNRKFSVLHSQHKKTGL